MKKTVNNPRPTERQIEILRMGREQPVNWTPRSGNHPFIVQLESWGMMVRTVNPAPMLRTAGEVDNRIRTSETTFAGSSAVDAWDAS